MSTITLKLSEIIAVNTGLSALDGYQKQVGETVAFIPFKFDDSTRWNIAKNRRLLKPEIEAYEEVRQSIVKELSPEKGDVGKESGRVLMEFNARTKPILDKPITISGLLRLKKESLLKDNANPIPGNVLELLMPLIDDGETKNDTSNN